MFDFTSVFQLDLKKISAQQWLAGLLLICGFACVGVGLWFLITDTTSQVRPVQIVSADEKTGVEANIMIDVSGAVNKPGLYSLSGGDRLAAAIAAAGGFSDQVSPDYVSGQLNLASKLTDGQKIYIPTRQEFVQISKNDTLDSGGDVGFVATDVGVSINRAEIEELKTLAGVGDKRAADIVANRPYAAIEELVSRKIITQTIFDNNRNTLKL